MNSLSEKVRGTSQPVKETSHLICCYFRLKHNSLLRTICLIDILFYTITLTFNLTWTLFEFVGKTSAALGPIEVPLHILYGTIILFNAILLVYSIHFKINYRKYNMLVRNKYFEVYFYLRILWGIMSCCVFFTIFILLLTAKTDQAQFPHFKQYVRISNIFSLLYVIYAVFCFSSSPGFKQSWYGMLLKDIDFYFE